MVSPIEARRRMNGSATRKKSGSGPWLPRRKASRSWRSRGRMVRTSSMTPWAKRSWVMIAGTARPFTRGSPTIIARDIQDWYLGQGGTQHTTVRQCRQEAHESDPSERHHGEPHRGRIGTSGPRPVLGPMVRAVRLGAARATWPMAPSRGDGTSTARWAPVWTASPTRCLPPRSRSSCSRWSWGRHAGCLDGWLTLVRLASLAVCHRRFGVVVVSAHPRPHKATGIVSFVAVALVPWCGIAAAAVLPCMRSHCSRRQRSLR